MAGEGINKYWTETAEAAWDPWEIFSDHNKYYRADGQPLKYARR